MLVIDLGRFAAFIFDLDGVITRTASTRAQPGLYHGRGVDMELDRGLMAGQHIALEVRRDIDDEGELAGIHELVIGQIDRLRRERRQERRRDGRARNGSPTLADSVDVVACLHADIARRHRRHRHVLGRRMG